MNRTHAQIMLSDEHSEGFKHVSFRCNGSFQTLNVACEDCGGKMLAKNSSQSAVLLQCEFCERWRLAEISTLCPSCQKTWKK